MADVKRGGEYSTVGSAALNRHYGRSVGNYAVFNLLQYKCTAGNRSTLFTNMQQQHTAAEVSGWNSTDSGNLNVLGKTRNGVQVFSM